MKFHDFLESTYVKTNNELQNAYSVYGHAKTLATKDLIDIQRSLMKFFSKFEILFTYVLVKLHLSAAPQTAQEIFEEANKKIETVATTTKEPTEEV